MFFKRTSSRFSWLRRLFARTPAANPPRSTRLLLEILEDRTVPTGLLVQTLPGYSSATMTTWLASHLPQGATFNSTRIDGLFEINTPDAQLAAVTSTIRANGHVAYVEKSTTLTVQLTPNDPRFTDGTLYGLNGAFGIKAPAAWDVTTGSTKVIVADIDTGIDYKHVDLYRNIWINQGEIPSSVRSLLVDVDGDGMITFIDLNNATNQGAFKITDQDADGRITGVDILRTFNGATGLGGWKDNIDNDAPAHATDYIDDLIGWNFVNNTNNPLDDNSHGTHVAGTIGAIGNNSTGVVGVNWTVQMMALKFLDAGGSGSDVNGANAIRYAADRGAQLSNNSWGSSGYSSTLFNAVSYARGKNHLFIAAAGNSGTNNDSSPFYPSNFNLDNVVAVAATDSSGNRASFSNYGATTVDLGAPGVSIYSTVLNGGYGYKSGTSMAAPHVAGAAALALASSPGLSYSALRDRILNTVTPLTSLAGITVTGGLLNVADAVANGPEIQVLDNVTNVADGGAVAFGSTFVGIPISKTFTVKNTGNQTLNLNTSITVPAGFTLTSADFGSTTVAAGASTTFTIRLNAAAAGSYSGSLSFGNNDANENPFNFTVSGTVGAVKIIDDGDQGFSTVGSWTAWSGQGYQNDVREAFAGSGSSVATWTFSVTPGQYKVSATWSAYENRATDSPFTVYDNAASLGTVQINQQVAPDDFTDSGASWENLGVFNVTSTTLVAKLANNANGNLNADAIRIERVGDLPSGPEIQVLDGGTDLADGSATVNYGTTPVGTPVSKTFTVKNIGNQNLTLGSLSVPSGFTVTANFGTTTVAAGASTTFTVRLNAAAAGSYSGSLSFGNNDANENPFNFTLTGTVVAVPVVQIIDDGDAGFSTVGSWTAWSNQGYQNDVREAFAGSGSAVASWTFTMTPGQYKVSATWTPYENRATDSPYTVYDGGASLGTVQVNQQVAPADFTDSGVNWGNLGVFTISGNTLVVKLSNNANGNLNADAIRIEKIG